MELAARVRGGVAADRRRKNSRRPRASAAEVDAAQASLDRLKAQKAFANIVAPFDGVVTARNVDVGSLVKADAERLGAVRGRRRSSDADLRPRPRVLRGRHEGRHEGDARACPNIPTASSRRRSRRPRTRIDQKSRTLLVELIADNADGALFPGAFARVHFQFPPDPNAVRVPANALIFRDNAVEVAVVGPDDRVS